jgi:hypothetical protein
LNFNPKTAKSDGNVTVVPEFVVKAKSYCGDVEKNGWQSTRIRLVSGHHTVVPNEHRCWPEKQPV